MPDSYKSIKHPSEGVYKEKGSRFIGLAYPVESEEDAKQCLEKIRKQYHDARHHGYAYRIGPEGEKVRWSDDGEPVHSAGPPIMGQIRALDLTNLLLVVVRYFGGTLLGVGRLTQAYKMAARDALYHASIIECTLDATVRLLFDYADLGRVMKLAGEDGVHWRNQQFADRCSLEVSFRASLLPRFLERLKAIPSVHVENATPENKG